jgi:hypothetical protein
MAATIRLGTSTYPAPLDPLASLSPHFIAFHTIIDECIEIASQFCADIDLSLADWQAKAPDFARN